MNNACTKCGSNKIVQDLRFIDRNESGRRDSSLETYKNPDALFFKGAEHHALKATACCNCGHVELVLKDPDRLWEAVKRDKL